jgi:hypothetical protein
MENDLEKTLEQIEGQVWPAPEYNSSLVLTCHALRKKPLKNFTVEDIRILIGQNMSLELLMPLAMEKLEEDFLAEGDCYPGDLLHSILTSDAEYWRQHQGQWRSIATLYEQHRPLLESDDTYRPIRRSFDDFAKLGDGNR